MFDQMAARKREIAEWVIKINQDNSKIQWRPRKSKKASQNTPALIVGSRFNHLSMYEEEEEDIDNQGPGQQSNPINGGTGAVADFNNSNSDQPHPVPNLEGLSSIKKTNISRESHTQIKVDDPLAKDKLDIKLRETELLEPFNEDEMLLQIIHLQAYSIECSLLEKKQIL